jgi:hypothetical protein
MFLDDLTRVLWRWWSWQRRVKRFRSWELISAVVTSCGVEDAGLKERLNLVFRYEVQGEGFWGSAFSRERPHGTTMRLEDNELEGRSLAVRVNPLDKGQSGILNTDNPEWPWGIEE